MAMFADASNLGMVFLLGLVNLLLVDWRLKGAALEQQPFVRRRGLGISEARQQ
jgi:hypothetical protein